MIIINKFKSEKINNKPFSSKSYKSLSKFIVVTYILFALVYIFRDKLYELDNQDITLFAETAPNLISSFIFTLIGVFYILPFLKGPDLINKPIFIWSINVVNIIVFSLIEYIHVVLNLGEWDNNDIVASLIGIIFSTAIYFKIRKRFI